MDFQQMQSLLDEVEEHARDMAVSHSLGGHDTCIHIGARIQAAHQHIGLYLLIRAWCAQLHTSTPPQHRTPASEPDISFYATQHPEDLHRLTHHLTRHTRQPPDTRELAHATVHATNALADAQHMITSTQPDTPPIDQRAVLRYLDLTNHPDHLGAVMAHLCHSAGRLYMDLHVDAQAAHLQGNIE